MPIHFCEAVVDVSPDGHPILGLTICAQPATHRIYGNLGRTYWVCDQHQATFAPKRPGETIRIGTT